MSDTNSILTLCTESVYNNNIFHILGLRTTATPRQIRRKREDLESAKTLGNDSWREAFKHLMGTRQVPSSEEVDEAFNHLEDPQFRIVSEFFWMWPTCEDDKAIDELLAGRRGNAFAIWEHEALGFGVKRIIARHNLAVAYQFYALDAELQSLDNDTCIPQEFRTEVLSYWEKSFSYWEELADNDDFWGIYESRMREFDDPRLTGGFVRQFRIEFPIAFDNINALLAARYAKASRFDDARRHVEYMSRTMSGLDDVQENMSIIFTPMEQRVDILVDGYDEKVKSDPKLGLEYANKLLEDTEEIRRVAAGLLKEDQRIRTGIFTKIVSACNRYQVQYGNKTEEWEGCLKLLERLAEIVCTPESKKVVEGNLETVKNNIVYGMCYFCKKEKADASHVYTVELYGERQKKLFSNKVTYKTVTIKVPRCAHCAAKHLKASDAMTKVSHILMASGAVIGAIIGACIRGKDVVDGMLIGGFVGAGLMALISVLFDVNKDSELGIDEDGLRAYPPIREWLEKGYKKNPVAL